MLRRALFLPLLVLILGPLTSCEPSAPDVRTEVPVSSLRERVRGALAELEAADTAEARRTLVRLSEQLASMYFRGGLVLQDSELDPEVRAREDDPGAGAGDPRDRNGGR